jgi:Zn-dependent M28 family amino/carboxypeptidase
MLTTLLVALPLAPPRPLSAQEADLDTLAIRAHTHFLSHDELEGRGTGSRGARVAAAYIAAQCRALGLQSVNGFYLQAVPLERAQVLEATHLNAAAPGGEVSFGYPADFTPNVGTAATLVDFQGAAFFVGGSDAVAQGAIGALDIAGKVAVTLGPVRGAAADTLMRRGAAGMINLVASDEGYELYARSRGATRLYHAEPDVRSSFIPELPSIIAGPRVARALLAQLAGLNIAEAEPQPLAWTVDARIALERSSLEARNVACVLPGSEPGARDTAIVFSAHYDHLGIGVPDERGDSIFNGFSDNAAGVAMLLAIADRLVRGEPLRHTALFLFPSGEERGLLGSDYYVARPLWPLEHTAAVINLDAGAPPGRLTSWHLAGAQGTELGELAVAVAAERGWEVKTSSARPNSDYYPFARERVAALLIIPGPAPYEGLSADSSAALKRRWEHYHEASDEWSEDFPFSGLARYAEYALLIARAVDGPR